MTLMGVVLLQQVDPAECDFPDYDESEDALIWMYKTFRPRRQVLGGYDGTGLSWVGTRLT
jgi:hypothetical protein